LLLAAALLAWRLHHPPPAAGGGQGGGLGDHLPPAAAPLWTGPEPQSRHEAPPRPLTSGWAPVAPGADYCVRDAGGGLSRIVAVRLDLTRYRVEVADLSHAGRAPQTVRDLVLARGALAAINGGYFDDNRRPLGALVHAGRQTNPPFRKDGGFFCVVAGRATIRATSAGLPAGVTEALQCQPRLITAGQPTPSFKPGESIRAAVGLTPSGALILAVTGTGELSLQDWTRALQSLGCADALNLDGGPSSQLYFHAGKTELDLPGAYPVPSALLVFKK
jgi:uncharacterized protein YigE (DUF2233 family)